MKNKISLIKLRKKHFSLFYKWWNDPVMRELTSEIKGILSFSDIDKILKDHLLNKLGFDFIITFNKKLIGHILIQRKRKNKNFEIYIAIGKKKYWNKGIGEAAMNKSCDWFFKNFPKEKLLKLQVLVHNHRAIKCYEKVGFKKIKLMRHKKSHNTWLMAKNK